MLEIGSLVAYSGQVKQVKVLGTFALLDEGETDWKIVAIDVNDPLAKDMHGSHFCFHHYQARTLTVYVDIGDVEKHMPGLLDATKTWFRIYKVPDGKPYNTFALNGAIKDKAYALNVIHETNDAWKRLIGGQIPCKTEKYNISWFVFVFTALIQFVNTSTIARRPNIQVSTWCLKLPQS